MDSVCIFISTTVILQTSGALIIANVSVHWFPAPLNAHSILSLYYDYYDYCI